MEVGVSQTAEMNIGTMDTSILANNIAIVYDEHIQDPNDGISNKFMKELKEKTDNFVKCKKPKKHSREK